MEYPLVSCMMLTYNRFGPLKKAIDCFLNQSYPNRELVIINSGNDDYYEKVTAYLKSDRIYPQFMKSKTIYKHVCAEKKSLGELRNLGIDYSSGQYIIVFDDDDYHHPDRIAVQMRLCLKSKRIHATLLRNFVAVKKRWFGDARYRCTIIKGLEGTLLFKKGDVRYPDMGQGEDTTFVDALKYAGYNMAIIDEPYEAYEYNFYGNNTVSKEHFNNMVELNRPLR